MKSKIIEPISKLLINITSHNGSYSKVNMCWEASVINDNEWGEV